MAREYELLVEKLRTLRTDEARARALCEISGPFSEGVFKAANATISTKSCFVPILRRGLETANASELSLVIKHIGIRMGFRALARALKDLSGEFPRQARGAAYWIPRYLPLPDDRSRAVLRELLVSPDSPSSGADPQGGAGV